MAMAWPSAILVNDERERWDWGVADGRVGWVGSGSKGVWIVERFFGPSERLVKSWNAAGLGVARDGLRLNLSSSHGGGTLGPKVGWEAVAGLGKRRLWAKWPRPPKWSTVKGARSMSWLLRREAVYGSLVNLCRAASWCALLAIVASCGRSGRLDGAGVGCEDGMVTSMARHW